MEENPLREIHFMHTSFCAWEPPQLLGKKRKKYSERALRRREAIRGFLVRSVWCGGRVYDVSGTRYGTEKVLRRSRSLSMWVFIEQRESGSDKG